MPADLILGKLAGGLSHEEVCREYDLTREDVLAALEYAASIIENERIHVAS